MRRCAVQIQFTLFCFLVSTVKYNRIYLNEYTSKNCVLWYALIGVWIRQPNFSRGKWLKKNQRKIRQLLQADVNWSEQEFYRKELSIHVRSSVYLTCLETQVTSLTVKNIGKTTLIVASGVKLMLLSCSKFIYIPQL